MKLNEIIDVQHSDSYHPGKYLGNGSFSTVYDDKEDPHMVVKINNGEFDEAFQLYVNELIFRNLMGNNIHAPRIYKKNDDTYQMEKLVPYKELNTKDLIAIMDKYEIPLDNRYAPTELGFHMTITEYISNSINNSSVIKSKKLQEIINVIKYLISEHGVMEDIGTYNIMYRRTPHGYQLVVSDPVCY